MLFFAVIIKSFTAVWQESLYLFFISFCLQYKSYIYIYTQHTYNKHLHYIIYLHKIYYIMVCTPPPPPKKIFWGDLFFGSRNFEVPFSLANCVLGGSLRWGGGGVFMCYIFLFQEWHCDEFVILIKDYYFFCFR